MIVLEKLLALDINTLSQYFTAHSLTLSLTLSQYFSAHSLTFEQLKGKFPFSGASTLYLGPCSRQLSNGNQALPTKARLQRGVEHSEEKPYACDQYDFKCKR